MTHPPTRNACTVGTPPGADDETSSWSPRRFHAPTPRPRRKYTLTRSIHRRVSETHHHSIFRDRVEVSNTTEMLATNFSPHRALHRAHPVSNGHPSIRTVVSPRFVPSASSPSSRLVSKKSTISPIATVRVAVRLVLLFSRALSVVQNAGTKEYLSLPLSPYTLTLYPHPPGRVAQQLRAAFDHRRVYGAGCVGALQLRYL